MLTIFTVPRAFRGEFAVIQNNAIQSWLSLQPKPEIILLGDEAGTADAASRFGVRHIAGVECNEYGTPLVSSLFSLAQAAASHQLMCYVNADIILLNDFSTAISRVRVPSFLVIGRRWDIDLEKPPDFGSPDWEKQLRTLLAESGKLHGISGLDYFVFPRGLYRDIPAFAIGRTCWDNWLVYRARALNVPVVDATRAITAVHQSHGYSHHLSGATGVWKGPEAQRNLELSGGKDCAFSIEYATWVLTPQGMRRSLSPRHLYFRLRAMAALHAGFHFLLGLFKALERIVIAFRSMRKPAG